MTLTWIILLVLLGLILFLAELVLLPGITVAAVGAFCCLVGAVSWAFVELGMATGWIVLGSVSVALTVLTLLFLRPRTWNRFALHTEIDSQVQPVEIDQQIAVGAVGTTLTRLAPMGKVDIGGRVYEAKSLDSYIDPRTAVVVTGYENANIIVKINA